MLAAYSQVEFAVNDGWEDKLDSPNRRAYERLLRKLLELPNRPAVVLIQTFRGFETSGQCVSTLFMVHAVLMICLLWHRSTFT